MAHNPLVYTTTEQHERIRQSLLIIKPLMVIFNNNITVNGVY